MLIGILSDTHGTLSPAAYAEVADCDHIIHAGDTCGPAILAELSELAPVTAVLGNNDYDEYGADVTHFATPVIGGVRFLIAHTPGDLKRALRGMTSALQPGDPVPHVAVHGHTHVPEMLRGKDASPASLLLCPGSVTRPRGGSKRTVIKLQVQDGAVQDVSFVELR